MSRDPHAMRRQAEREILDPLVSTMKQMWSNSVFEDSIPCPDCATGTKFIFMNLFTGTVIRECRDGHRWAALEGKWELL